MFPFAGNLRGLLEIRRSALEYANELTLDFGDDPPEPVSVSVKPSSGYLSIADAAEHFGVSVKTIRRRIASREWPSIRVGRQIRIDVDAITSTRRRTATDVGTR